MRSQNYKIVVKDKVLYHLTTERENGKIVGYVLKVTLPQVVENVWGFVGVGELK